MFKPSFILVDNTSMAADIINSTHEDYPLRVDCTIRGINHIGAMCNNPSWIITEHTIKALHAFIMPDLQACGQYRTCDVKINDDVGCAHYLIQDAMQDILPLEMRDEWQGDIATYFVNDIKHIQNWYIRFEMIHPFEDGNGRVGGIILAAVSKYLTGNYCVAI